MLPHIEAGRETDASADLFAFGFESLDRYNQNSWRNVNSEGPGSILLRLAFGTEVLIVFG